MSIPSIRSIPNLIFVTVAIVVGGLAQPPGLDFNRPQIFDVQHYRIDVRFDRNKKEVIGDTAVSLKPLKNGLNSVELDAVDINVRSVTLEPTGVSLQFKNTKKSIV